MIMKLLLNIGTLSWLAIILFYLHADKHAPVACCCYWLLCSDIVLANKAAGKPNWYHPASLTSGGRYANGSAPMRCVQAASGMLASSWHMHTSRRQAEGIRWRWSLTGVEGVSEESIPPVWGVGMAGLLQLFQEAQGTGFYMVNWGCKVSCALLLIFGWKQHTQPISAGI
jgi:hypothetical protein